MLNTQTDTDLLLSQWLASGKRSSAHTAEAYTRDIRAFLAYASKPLDQITVGDVAGYQALLRQQCQPATEHRKISSIRSFFSFLKAARVIQEDIAALISSPKVESKFKDRSLTEDEVEAMIGAAESMPLDALLIRFLYITAGRVSEVLSLTWANLVPAESQDGGGYVRILGKGKKTREIYIGAELWDDLVRARGDIGQDEPLFPFDRFQVWAIVKKLAKGARVTGDVSPHWFRHSHASHALQAGASLTDIRDDLGHSDVKITSLYLHADPERATAKRLRIK
ncbi:MAG TPA: tyrosine-type recombinase/integrase [Blastocatellia bacterium]|nr:tyrosine-type recombinase/integrase [Blastocatellia bacterium]